MSVQAATDRAEKRGTGWLPVGLVLLGLLVPTPSRAALPSLLLPVDPPPHQEMLLVVLEAARAGEVRLLASRRAPGRARLPHAAASSVGVAAFVFALMNGQGEPLVAGLLEPPWQLHGPIEVSADGEVRCRALSRDRGVFSPKLPLPEGAARLLIFERSSLALPAAGELVSALRADPSVLGLQLKLALDLDEVPR